MFKKLTLLLGLALAACGAPSAPVNHPEANVGVEMVSVDDGTSSRWRVLVLA